MKFGDKLIVLRKKNGLSQEELAEKLGVSRQSVSKWESNNTYPETDKIVQICNLFDCSMDDLINDKVTDVESTLRKNKNNFNEVWDSLLEFITKTINMFSHMKFSTGLKCVIEMAILAFLLWLVGLGVCGISSNIIAGLFDFFGSRTTSIIRNVLENIFSILWFVLAIIVLVHTFKIRYLNYFEEEIEKKEESKSKDKNHKDDEKLNLKTTDRVIIRDEKDKPFAFLSVLSKIVLFFIKFIVFWIAFGSIFAIVGLIVASIVSLAYIPTHSLFVGSTLSLISATVIGVLFLLLCIYFIISKKVNVKVFVITFVVSLVLFGTGIGIFALSIKNIEFINKDNLDTLGTEKLTVPVEDNLVITSYELDEYTYIIDDSIPADKIEVEVGYDKSVFKINHTNHDLQGMKLYIPTASPAISEQAYLKSIVKDLKNNKLYINRFEPSIYSLTIKANSNVINNLISNADKLYMIKKEVNGNTIKVQGHGLQNVVQSGRGYVNYDARTGELIYSENTPKDFKCLSKTVRLPFEDRTEYRCYTKEEYLDQELFDEDYDYDDIYDEDYD